MTPLDASETLTCQTCGTTWTRKRAKGRKPKLCESCKDDPNQVKKKQVLDEEEKRRVAADRVFALEDRLKARGNHIGQQDILTTLKEQLAALTERVELLEAREAVGTVADNGDSVPVVSKRKAVHRKSGKGA